jgi:hypothetical protein
MSTQTTPPTKRWVSYGEGKQKIEACIGSDGRYLLSLWLKEPDPLLPRHYLPGRKWAAYDADRVAELLKPMQTPIPV